MVSSLCYCGISVCEYVYICLYVCFFCFFLLCFCLFVLFYSDFLGFVLILFIYFSLCNSFDACLFSKENPIQMGRKVGRLSKALRRRKETIIRIYCVKTSIFNKRKLGGKVTRLSFSHFQRRYKLFRLYTAEKKYSFFSLKHTSLIW